jgi:ribonuclease HI
MTGRPQPTTTRRGVPFRVLQVNVQHAYAIHLSALRFAEEIKADVVLIQEPYCMVRDEHCWTPAQLDRYHTWLPIHTWTNDSDRPRVATYTRHDRGFNVVHQATEESRDLLWTKVNDVTFCNVYRQPGTSVSGLTDVLQRWDVPDNAVVAGDFNIKDPLWQPDGETSSGSWRLRDWALGNSLLLANAPGVPTHELGGVIDLVFSNVPFLESQVVPHLHTGSDHFTIVTDIPGAGADPSPTPFYRLRDTPEAKLLFARTVRSGLSRLPISLDTTEDLERFATDIGDLLSSSLRASGAPIRPGPRCKPWWTPACTEAKNIYHEALEIGVDPDECRLLKKKWHKIIAEAKKAVSRNFIENATSDRDIFKIVGWHRKRSQLQPPGLSLPDGTIAEDPREKALALRKALLERNTADDDIPDAWIPTVPVRSIPWDNHVPYDEAYRSLCCAGNTSPGADKITVSMLRAAWDIIGERVRQFYQRCLELGYHPRVFRQAEVVMIPKPNKDQRTVKGWRPISLLSCVGKGLERLFGRRLAWLTLENKVLNPQHAGALPKRSAVDIVGCLHHDVEVALSKKQFCTMITFDIQGAFDAVLRRRLLLRLREQGWPDNVVHLVDSFMKDRCASIRYQNVSTDMDPLFCGLPQGSPASPILFLLYIEPIHKLSNPENRYGYADDGSLLGIASNSLVESAERAQKMLDEVIAWGAANKVALDPAKTEIQHFCSTNAGRIEDLPTIQHGDRTVTAPEALKWLGVHLDRTLSFRTHILKRSAAAQNVARHLAGLGKVYRGAPPASVTKAMRAVVIPKATYGAEIWYPGRKKFSAKVTRGEYTLVSNGLKDHTDRMQVSLNSAIRACLPVWRTTRCEVLWRESSTPPIEHILDAIRARHALRLRSLDEGHPLVQRSLASRARVRSNIPLRPTSLQSALSLCLPFPRPLLQKPRYTGDTHLDPVTTDKKTAAAEFNKWLETREPGDLTVYSDGSKHKLTGGGFGVGFGYVVHQDGDKKAEGTGQLVTAEVFDAEAEGARHGLRAALTIAEQSFPPPRITVCIDNTADIRCLRGTASLTSQDAFLEFQRLAQDYQSRCAPVDIRWAPGHEGIPGNEEADVLAKHGAAHGEITNDECTRAYAKRIMRMRLRVNLDEWWEQHQPAYYRPFKLKFTTKPTDEILALDRQALHRLIAARSRHGDFAAYHSRFKHQDAVYRCLCGRHRTPTHIFFCKRTVSGRPRVHDHHPRTREKLAEYLGKRWQVFIDLSRETLFWLWNCPSHKESSGAWTDHLEDGGTHLNFPNTLRPLVQADPRLLEALQKESKSFRRRIKESKLLKRRAEKHHNVLTGTDTDTSSSSDSQSRTTNGTISNNFADANLWAVTSLPPTSLVP